MWGMLAFGVFLTLIWGSQAFRSTVAPDASRKVAFVLLAVASFGWMAWCALRPVLIADASGVLVRNLWSTRRMAWDEIQAFRIGRYKLYGTVCVIDLKDGSSTYAFAIQVPNIARRRRETRESRIVAYLNARLARLARTGGGWPA
jgi:hypothetical protein